MTFRMQMTTTGCGAGAVRYKPYDWARLDKSNRSISLSSAFLMYGPVNHVSFTQYVIIKLTYYFLMNSILKVLEILNYSLRCH